MRSKLKQSDEHRHPPTLPDHSDPPTTLDALVVAPHPDDAELGMGGTIVRLIQQGWKLGILDLTDGEPTPLGSRERRASETAAANAALGNPWRKNLGLPNRSLEPALLNRRAVAAVFRQVRPRLVFAPYWDDAHPDHTAATKLVEDARFWSKLSKSDIAGKPFHPARILYYFSVHLRIVERPGLVIDISDQVNSKVAALQCFRSQLVENQPEGRPGVIDLVCDRTRVLGPVGRSSPCRALRQPGTHRFAGARSALAVRDRSTLSSTQSGGLTATRRPLIWSRPSANCVMASGNALHSSLKTRAASASEVSPSTTGTTR